LAFELSNLQAACTHCNSLKAQLSARRKRSANKTYTAGSLRWSASISPASGDASIECVATRGRTTTTSSRL
jgi:hypothetical protein